MVLTEEYVEKIMILYTYIDSKLDYQNDDVCFLPVS